MSALLLAALVTNTSLVVFVARRLSPEAASACTFVAGSEDIMSGSVKFAS